MSAIDVSVTLKGPFFTKRIDDVVKRAIGEEAIDKITLRMLRGGKGRGVRRNRVSREIASDWGPSGGERLVMAVISTLIPPRTKGTAWIRKNKAIAKAMAPHVMRAAARRIVADLGDA